MQNLTDDKVKQDAKQGITYQYLSKTDRGWCDLQDYDCVASLKKYFYQFRVKP